MHDSKLLDAPLDLLNAGRDELVDGHCPIQVASQFDDEGQTRTPAVPPSSTRRCDSAHRELLGQSGLLLPDAATRKPR